MIVDIALAVGASIGGIFGYLLRYIDGESESDFRLALQLPFILVFWACFFWLVGRLA
jgi:hypothetical protein